MVAADSGQAADLAIVSLSLPERQRNELLATLRARRPQVKLAAIIAVAGPQSLRAADLMGAQAVFARPLDSATVTRRVRELLRAHPVPYTMEDIAAQRRLFPGAR